jgi:FkbM family methyltransferase
MTPVAMVKNFARRSNTVRSAYVFARETLDRARRYGIVNRGGHGIVGLIDVGSVGSLPQPWNKRCDLLSHVMKFEPRDPRGEARHVVTIDAALWNESGKRPFYVYSGSQGEGSSLFRQNVAYVHDNIEDLKTRGSATLARTWFDRARLDHVEEVECTTLDQVLGGRSEPYHVLKVDAQGAELQILEGGIIFLTTGNCLALHLELFTVPLYEGIALRQEVIDFVDNLGFELVKQFPPHGTFDAQNDCVFMRRGASGPVAAAIRTAYEL